MFFNHLRIAFRQLLKYKVYAAINIFGLSVGIAASLLIWQMLRYEMQYNHNFAQHERIGRLYMRTIGNPSGDRADRGVTVPAMIEFQQKITDIEASSRIREDWPTITVPDPAGGPPLKKISAANENIGFFVEPGFFKVFDLHWVAGSPSQFEELGSTVLNRSSAEILFGTPEAAIGKNIMLDNTVPSIVRGVYEDLPHNCDIAAYALTSFVTLRAHRDAYSFDENDWGSTSSNDQMFFLLKDRSQFSSLAPAVAAVGKSRFDEIGKSNNMTAQIGMQPLDEVHFDEEIASSVKPTTARSRLWTLGLIGILVLAMACFNFINLATALAANRAREVGVRKAIGGQKSTLVAQFMTETGLITLLAILLGCGLAQAALPYLSQISFVPPGTPLFSDPLVWAFLSVTGLLVMLLSGLWPSFVLAGLSPVRALRNAATAGVERGITLRKGLIVMQFAVAQALLIGAVVTVVQLDFLQKMDIGVSKDLVLNARFNNDSLSLSKLDFLKSRLLQIPTVETVSFSTDEPTSGNTWATNMAFGRGEDEPFSTTTKFTDGDFAKTYGLQMVAGRWYENSDTVREYVVNESLLRKVGITAPADAIGQEMRLGGGRFRRICGVVKDFHTQSAHVRSRHNDPLVMAPRKRVYSHLSVKIKSGDAAKTKEEIQKVYDAAFPEQVFDPTFFDEMLASFYEKEAQFSAFARGIALLAVLIGCLGLFGLASHMAVRRTKEIGVRKVLGASVAGITGLLAKDFLKLVVVAIVVASPIAYYFMKKWLSDFAYRIDIQWWMFVSVGALAVLIAFLTVSFQSVKAALVNPVKSLRSE